MKTQINIKNKQHNQKCPRLNIVCPLHKILQNTHYSSTQLNFKCNIIKQEKNVAHVIHSFH